MQNVTKAEAEKRLEYLRGEIQAERISYGEIAELQSLAPFIDSGDVELLEWAGVPEKECQNKDENGNACYDCEVPSGFSCGSTCPLADDSEHLCIGVGCKA